MQLTAFRELLELKKKNIGSKTEHGAIGIILKKYAEGGYSEYVTRSNMRYRMGLYEKGKRMHHERPTDIISVPINDDDNDDDISPLESPIVADVPTTTTIATSSEKKSGRKVGTTKKAKKRKRRRLMLVQSKQLKFT